MEDKVEKVVNKYDLAKISFKLAEETLESKASELDKADMEVYDWFCNKTRGFDVIMNESKNKIGLRDKRVVYEHGANVQLNGHKFDSGRHEIIGSSEGGFFVLSFTVGKFSQKFEVSDLRISPINVFKI